MFTPSPETLSKYAEILVNFALNSGHGIKPGEVVRLVVAESAKPLYVALRDQILKSGGHPLTFYLPDDTSRSYYELATSEQLNFYPAAYYLGLSQTVDHTISIISETNKRELEGIDPSKIMARGIALKPFRDLLDAKENEGKYTWTLALYGTPAMAAEAGLSLEDYWQEIITACFLNTPDPIGRWREVFAKNQSVLDQLNSMPINQLHITGAEVDLKITLGKHRKWLGGSGRNIPSFEVFVSPDWRGTEGWIRFNQPLYRYGNLIKDIRLEFSKGLVVKSSSSTNESVLKQMIATSGADKIGEFSLTDKRLSPISKFMAETLFDENTSGPFGNTHIALGRAYQDSYTGDPKQLSKSDWENLGYNDSSVHTDIVSTTDRTVTAYLTDGSKTVIYQNGMFTFLP